ncbi:secretin N-terminal domain-containing protein [Sulfurirhabdus autotrophica]|uniref:Type II/III secretion system protein n=1 Tax=Sulfurirhabdus autotrophica TaxID=1706046 RepID=A0A4R3YH97_9PROT|nr:type II/III secretion system protein [Sulfurirhabdus autotrophica]
MRLIKSCLWPFLFLTLFSPVSLSYADQTVLEIIPLKHRTVDQVLPILQPFVEKQGAINGMNNQLIIRATPANLSQIKEILNQIDTVQRKLLITVKQSTQRDIEGKEAEVSGRLGVGDNARVVVGSTRSRDGGSIEVGRGGDVARARVYSSQRQEDSANTQQLQVLEGGQAFIRMGTSVPVPERTVVRNGQTVTVIQGTSYRDVTSGFYVRPRIQGNRVTLEISPQNNTVDSRGRINIQQAQTEVSGRIGEWMEIGGINQERSVNESGIAYSTNETGQDQRRILLKVEELK